MTKIDFESWLAGAVCAAMLAVFLLGWVVKSHFEAAAYHRITGRHVSTWDAMFVDLRVTAEPED